MRPFLTIRADVQLGQAGMRSHSHNENCFYSSNYHYFRGTTDFFSSSSERVADILQAAAAADKCSDSGAVRKLSAIALACSNSNLIWV